MSSQPRPRQRSLGVQLTLRAKLIILIMSVASALVVTLTAVAFDAIQRTSATAQHLSERALESQAEAHIAKVTGENAERNSGSLDEILSEATLLAAALSAGFTTPGPAARMGAAGGDIQLRAGEGGEHLEGDLEAAAIYIPNYVPVDASVLQQIGVSRLLDPLARTVLARDSSAATVYFCSKEGLVRYYPKSDLGLPADFSVADEGFFTLANPESNPLRESRWTTVYDDPAGLGLMVSATAPVYTADDRFVGMVGIDVCLDDLSASIESTGLGDEPISILLDGEGRSIAMPDAAYPAVLRRPRRDGEFGGSLREETSPLAIALLSMVDGQEEAHWVESGGDEYFVVFSPLRSTGWGLATLVAKESVLREVSLLREILTSEAKGLALNKLIPIGLFILAVVGSFGVAIACRFTEPLRRLTIAAKAIGRSEWDVEFEQDTDDEVGRLAGTLAQMAAQLQDVFKGLESRVEERTVELEDALHVAESAMEARTSFLANMSHEIRTPLNGVIGMASLLGEAPLGPEEQSQVEVIHSCADALLTTINDILDFSKLDAGKVTLEERSFDPAELVRRSVSVIHGRAQEKGLELVTDTPQLGSALVGDAVRLQQVLLNFLSNAVKFTERGTVAVRYLLRSEGPGGLRVRFEVKDDGIGVANDVQSELFTPFTQADATTTRRFGGTGLGLSIARGLIDQMGGEIGVESHPGKGSCFYFEVDFQGSPLVEDEPLQPAADCGMAEAAKRILLVEDNAVNRLVACRMLAKIGHGCDVAENGLLAVEAVQAAAYDIVLMDMQMPVMDGLEATRRIRALPDLEQPLIVALTANVMEDDRRGCAEAGMDGFMAKPLVLEDLRRLLGAHGRAVNGVEA